MRESAPNTPAELECAPEMMPLMRSTSLGSTAMGAAAAPWVVAA